MNNQENRTENKRSRTWNERKEAEKTSKQKGQESRMTHKQGTWQWTEGRTCNRYILKNAETCCFESNSRSWYSRERAPTRRWIADQRRRYATIFSLRDCCTTAWRNWNLLNHFGSYLNPACVRGTSSQPQKKNVWKNLRRWHSFRYATTYKRR